MTNIGGLKVFGNDGVELAYPMVSVFPKNGEIVFNLAAHLLLNSDYVLLIFSDDSGVAGVTPCKCGVNTFRVYSPP